MIKNYFKIAWRNLLKSKFYSLINIVGLSVGIAFTLLIAVYVWGELQVNHQLKNTNNQYILQSKWKNPDMGYELSVIAELPKALKQQYPGLVKNYCRWDGVTSSVSKGDKHFREGILLVDSTLLNMYGFRLLYGDAKTALNNPFSVVISAEKAKKYFGHTDVIGQTITIENFAGGKHDFLISGVLSETGKNSVTYNKDGTNNDFFIPIEASRFMGRNVDGWNNTGLVGFVELKDGITPKDLEAPIRHLIKNNSSAQINQNITQYLIPLKKYYLVTNNGVVQKMIYTLSAIAAFILLMAVINFVNLCISRSSARMREMGVRKVLGGSKKQLIWQFLVESILLVMSATVAALVLFQLFNPYFSNVLGKDILTLFEFPSWFFLVIIGLGLFIGLASGIYPAFILSSLKSVDSLKGKLSTAGENVFIRKGLVAFQFGMATLVLISALIISQQVKLFFSKDLGYSKDFVVTAQVPRDWSKTGVQHMESIRTQFTQTTQVTAASLSWEIPNGANGGNVQIYRQGADSTQAVASQGMATDNQYAVTYNIPVKAGRFFDDSNIESNVNHVSINETEARALGWNDPKDAIGQQIRVQGNNQPYTIVGVTADFHFGSMQQIIKPITIFNVNATTYYRYLSFKLKPGDINKSLEALQQKWASILPGAPFEYQFMDDTLAKLYKTEIQLRKASYIATSLAIIIAFLGIIGLISLSIQKRIKEIGIRKVLGSSIGSIVSLFIKDFLVIIIIAAIVASPLAYLLMQKWLNDYAYKIAITANPFILSITAITIITTLLIVTQTIRTALANPVKSLKSE